MWALILFSVCMTVALLFLLLICIGVSVLKEKVKQNVRNHYQTFMPLSNGTEAELKQLDLIQRDFRCCGLINGYQDWGEKIPVSCLCSVDKKPLNVLILVKVQYFYFAIISLKKMMRMKN
ncbi:hypothetical protein UPYG_G00249040 [Umbra pygmaea]|uniref:Uncharacterized protein n=1 Tax=Umbra pygmaea TaxID=75934 RepID=A0ABD0WNT1_UMBPY